jgi:hypothetical protein
MYVPRSAEVRLDPEILGTAPGSMLDEAWRLSNLDTVGVLDHETAHAAHTLWTVGDLEELGAGAPEIDAVALLEEARCEKRAAGGAAGRTELRAAAMSIAVRDFDLGSSPSSAAAAAALVLARQDAGLLSEEDAAEVRSAVAGVLGEQLLDGLRQLWLEFLLLDDTDFPGMASVAGRWVRLTGGRELHAQSLHGLAGTAAERSRGISGRIAAIGLRADAEAVRRSRGLVRARPGRPGTAAVASRPAGERAPDADERAAAAAFAGHLEGAGGGEPEVVRVMRPAPPGRLSGRSAARRAAYRDVGIRRDVEVFRRKLRTTGDRPRLSVGVMGDVSGSMAGSAGAAASLVWIVADGARRAGARTAVVHFGEQVRGASGPSGTVVPYRCTDHWENFSAGFAAVDGILGPTGSGGPRLLVVVTDADFRHPDQRSAAEALMRSCRSQGVAVLWTAPPGARVSSTYGHGAVVVPRGPLASGAGDALGRAAAALLHGTAVL